MKKISSSCLLVLFVLGSGCSSLNSAQKRELKEFQAKNLEVQEKNPTAAAGLNVLPGFGDFYNGNIGLGVANLLTWPLSILWAPVGGATGADEVNYYASKAHVEALEANKKKLRHEVEITYISKQINQDQFILANKKIDMMNLTEFERNVDIKDVLPMAINPTTSRVPSSTR